jgi:hypothetical protein
MAIAGNNPSGRSVGRRPAPGSFICAHDLQMRPRPTVAGATNAMTVHSHSSLSRVGKLLGETRHVVIPCLAAFAANDSTL